MSYGSENFDPAPNLGAPASQPQRIRQLPLEVITKIAAGEVIERPASVVKELLENSVDAGATRIDVEIEQGGAELIRVVDDGCGIPPEDLPLAFASHATSKLVDADDLFRVGSYGFRGEALASIGGVAQVTLRSRLDPGRIGAEVFCDGGKLSEVRPWNGAPGTCIEVRRLFFNTPVRRKFLRATGTEAGHIAEQVTRLALARPTLTLKLTHNGRLVYEVPSSAGLRDRLRLFFGSEVEDRLMPVEAAQGPVRLSGFIADPACDAGNARLQYLFVNGRWIRDRALSHALQEAYRGLVMVGRHPVAFVFLELPPDQVDVNVHPTKSEVRFRDGHAVYHLVLASLREKLRSSDLVARLQVRPIGSFPNAVPLLQPSSTQPDPWARDFFAPRPALTQPSLANGGTGSEATTERQETPVTERTVPPEGPANLKAIQLYDAYLVVETPEGMLVIDQHALHERIIYEHWKERIGNGTMEIQRLLVPEPVDLPAEQAATALDNKALLERLGLGIEDFGGGTVLVTSYPAMFRNGAPADILRTAVEYLVGNDRPPGPEQLLEKLLALMACKAAIKAGDHLGPEEIAALIAQRGLADHTHHCPHGRPTALLFSRQELDRQFKRT